MTIGVGIFLSAVLLSIVILFVATRDRWNWRRLAKWVIGAPMLLIALLFAGLWGYSKYEDIPRAQTEYWDIKLDATQADVKFLKGEPSEVIEGDRWVYYEKDTISGKNISGYVIRWNDGAVRYVMYATSEAQYIHPSLQGFQIGADYHSVISGLREPAHTSTSADGLRRMISYPQYRTFYTFEKGKLKDYGIYNTSMGPMEFEAPAASAPTSAASAAWKQAPIVRP